VLPKKVVEKLRQLCEASGLRQRHAAVVLRGTKVVAYGVNRNKTHPMAKKFSKNPEAIYLHAELDAIVRALTLVGPRAIVGATIAVCRTTRDGRYADSRPCEGCQRAIEAFGLKVEYTTKEGWTE
jgi:deoxycytidylate deaminase